MQVLLNFTDENDYNFDSNRVVFISNEPTLKDQRPVGAIFYSGFNSGSLNANWGDGSLSGVGIGGAATLNNELNLSFGDLRYVYYDAVDNALMTAAGTIRAKITPNYSGAPVTEQDFIVITGPTGNRLFNLLQFRHSVAGNLEITILDNAGNSIATKNFGAWSPIAGTKYSFEISFSRTDDGVDTTGTLRIFINGIQFSTTYSEITAGALRVRDTNIQDIRIGTDYADAPAVTSNFKIDEIEFYNTVLNTTNFIESTDLLPQTVYAIDNPLILTKAAFTADEIATFLSNYTLTEVSDNIKFVFQVNGDLIYHDGSVWKEVATEYTDSNTLAEVQANISTLLDPNSKVRMGFYLHSELGSGTGTPPKMTDITFVFHYADQTESLPATCEVKIRTLTFGAVPIEGAFVSMAPLIPDTLDFLAHSEKNALIANNTYEGTTDENGKININAIPSNKYLGGLTVKYQIEVSKESMGYLAKMLFLVPDLVETDLDIDPRTLANQV